jgi:polyisoprenoid-binding protein YceI
MTERVGSSETSKKLHWTSLTRPSIRDPQNKLHILYLNKYAGLQVFTGRYTIYGQIHNIRAVLNTASSFHINYCTSKHKTRNTCRSIIQIVTTANGFTHISMKQPSFKFRSTNFKQNGNLNSENTNFYVLHYKEQPMPPAAQSKA